MTAKQPSSESALKSLNQVCDEIRLKHYSIRTEQSYVDWIKRFVYFHGKHHPKDMGVQAVPGRLEGTHWLIASLLYGGKGVVSPLDC